MAIDEPTASRTQTSLEPDPGVRTRPALHLPTALLAKIHTTIDGTDTKLEAQLHSLLEHQGIGVFRAGLDGQLLHGSPAFRRLLGIAPDDDVRSHNLYRFFVRHEPRPLGARLEALGQIHAQEAQLRRTDGTVVWAELTETLYQRGGEGTTVEGLTEEITDRKRAEEAMWLGEEYFRALIEGTSDLVFVLDPEGVVRYISSSVYGALGYRPEELIGTRIYELVHPDGRNEAQRIVSDELRAAGIVRAAELKIGHQHGGWRVYDALLQNLVHDPVVSGVVVSARDVTARRRAERTLREGASRLRLALQASRTGIWELNIRSGRMRGSENLNLLLGRGSAPFRGTYGEFLKMIYPADVDRVSSAVTHAIDERRDFELDFRVAWPDGTVRWICAKGRALVDRTGAAARLIGTAVDDTDRKQAQDKLLHDAFHDALTGLANRALFMDRMTHTIAVAERHPGYYFGVLIVDLDHFKQINDSLGHLIGDQLLIAAARRLERCLRPGDTVARWGGDEFTVLLDDLHDARDATRVADRVLRELRVPFSVEGNEIYTSASVGIAFSSTGFGRPDDLLRNADTALYRAKMRGRNRYEAFDQEMHRRSVALLQLEADLRQAVERGELRVVYQPIVSLASGTIGGFEALLRWEHAQRGTLTPVDFLAVAEDAGLMLELDRWVLEQACRQLTDWAARFPDVLLQISVNLSSKDFAHAELVDRVRTVLEQTGTEGANLRLELRENVFFENREAAAAILKQLKDLKVQLQIDDFGIGTSAVTSLHHFPIDAFKIDRSVIGRLGADDRAPGIVRSLVDMAHNLEMTVIAEGTETAEQLRLLRELGCDYAQGYLFAQPAESAQAEALLSGAPSW